MPVTSGLYWECHGDPAAPPIILSAGLGGTGDYWASNVAALAARHRVYLYDHRGTGRSTRDLPEQLNIASLAADLIMLMDGLMLDRAILMGHAAGGAAAMTVALDAPHRVAGLILINAWSRPDPHFARCMDVRLGQLAAGGPRAYLEAQPVFLYPANWSSLHDAALRKALPDHIDHFQGAETLIRRVQALKAFDVDDRLAHIAADTLILASQDDMLVPSLCSDHLADGIAHARLVRMPTGGHACNVVHPEIFNTIVLDWLSSRHA